MLSLELTEKFNFFKKCASIRTLDYKSYGTRWIYHKLKSMEIVLRSYGEFMQHLESVAQTDSQSLKWAELDGYAKK